MRKFIEEIPGFNFSRKVRETIHRRTFSFK